MSNKFGPTRHAPSRGLPFVRTHPRPRAQPTPRHGQCVSAVRVCVNQVVIAWRRGGDCWACVVDATATRSRNPHATLAESWRTVGGYRRGTPPQTHEVAVDRGLHARVRPARFAKAASSQRLWGHAARTHANPVPGAGQGQHHHHRTRQGASRPRCSGRSHHLGWRCRILRCGCST